MKNQPFFRRAGFAWQGIFAAWRGESSLRTHLAATFGVVVVLATTRPAPLWWAVLLLTCAMVIAAELLNTALEHALDLIHPEPHPTVRMAKDCGAGAVLVLSIGALAVFIAFLASR
jgi:diacylglycerol kinase (ATP)